MMENRPDIHDVHHPSETERRWQTLASILGVLLTAATTCIFLGSTISWYMDYPLFSITFIIAWRLTLNIFAIIIMVSFVIYLWCTQNGTNGFKTEFWATVLSLILTTGSVAFLLIDAYVKFECIDILQEHNCPIKPYLIGPYCDIAFLIIQFVFLHFTNIQVVYDFSNSNIRYFSKYLCLTLLLVANYSVWLGWALYEFRLFTFEQNEDLVTVLPCNVAIPFNSSSLVTSCLKFAESEDHLKLSEKAVIFLFGCILENCLLSISHHWYKFISLNSLDSKTSTSTSMFASTGINESSRLLENSIKASYSSSCNNVDTTDAHSANLDYNEEDLFATDDRYEESKRSENAGSVSVSSGIFERRCNSRITKESPTLNDLKVNTSKMSNAIKCAIISSIAYIFYVIVLRMKDLKSDTALWVFQILTTTVHTLFSFIPNLIATCILLTGSKNVEIASRTVSLHNEQPYVSHLNRVILFLSATATCVIFLLGLLAGYHGRDLCIHHRNHTLINNLTCNPLDYNLLIYQNAYNCLPFILQLFVVLNIQSVTKRSKNFGLFRCCLTIVAICNITYWAADSFTISFKESQCYQYTIFGESNWFVIMHVIYPCFTFYRMYSFEILIEYSCHHLPEGFWLYIKAKLVRR